MVFLYLIFVVVVGLAGQMGHVVDALNAGLGTDLSGVIWFFIGWGIALLIDAIFGS